MASPFYGVAIRWSAVVVAIVALSPAPLTIPSGMALAMIGLVGAVALMHPIRRPAVKTLVRAQRHEVMRDFACAEPHGESGGRV